MKNPFLTVLLFLATTLNLCYSQNTENILFETGKSTITKVNSEKLRTLYQNQFNNATEIWLVGHTDNVGDSLANILLSSERVEAVRKVLVDFGLNSRKITTKHLGENSPLNSNKSERDKQINRRVEIQWINPTPEKIENVEQAETGDIQDLYDLLAQKKEVYCINPGRDTILYLPQGTIISIPANAFNTSQVDCITFRTKEVYKKSDMILENLNTMSGSNILESGGMIYTEAVDENGLNLALNEGKSLTVMMPTDTILDGMSLFDGTRDPHSNQINWNNSGSPSITGIDFGDCMPYEYRERDSCERCKILFCRLFGRIDETAKGMTDPQIKKLNKEFRNCQKKWRKTPEVFLPYSTYYDSTNCSQLMAEMGVNNWSELQDTLQAIRNQRMQNLFKQYGVNNYDDYQDTIYKLALQAEQLQFAKREALGTLGNDRKISKTRQKAALKTAFEYYKVDNFKDYQDTIRKLAKQEAAIAELRYYVANTQKLGWINCDRFSSYSKNRLTNMKVNVKANSNTTCMAVFRRIKSVMNAYPNEVYVFNSIPKNLSIWLVVLKYSNNQPYLFLEKTMVQDSIDNINFRPLSVEELKNELKQLDQ